nr:hypothetical protein [Tanacetum cinerariifolium]
MYSKLVGFCFSWVMGVVEVGERFYRVDLRDQTNDSMDGHVDTPSENAGRPQSSVGVDPFVAFHSSAAPGTSGDDIERDLFPYVPGPYYDDYPDEGLIGGSNQISRNELELPHDPTFEILNK